MNINVSNEFYAFIKCVENRKVFLSGNFSLQTNEKAQYIAGLFITKSAIIDGRAAAKITMYQIS